MTNLIYFKHWASNLINECTLYTKCISVILISFYALSYIPHASQFLAVIPAFIIPPKFWIFSLLTFSFFESKIIFILLDVVLTFFIEKLLLPIWGWLELMKFCALVNCLSAISVVCTYVVCYVLTYNEFYLFHVEIHGMAPLLAALTVSSRQLMGDNVLLNMKIGKYRNKHITMTIMLCFVVLYLLSLVSLTVFVMYINGLIISWIYLRFYQRHANGIVGDLSEKFSFSGFFPYYLEGPVSIVTNSIFAALIYLRICNKIDRRYDISSPTSISISVSSGDGTDSERRKQLALKALNDRLSRPEKNVNWPTLDDDKDVKKKATTIIDIDSSKPLTKVFSDKYHSSMVDTNTTSAVGVNDYSSHVSSTMTPNNNVNSTD